MRAVSDSDAIRDEFRQAAGSTRQQNRKPVATPFSIRLSDDERKTLLREAGRLSLAAHIRARLFGEAVSPRWGKEPSRKAQRPGVDRVALGRVLAMLGRSELHGSLATMARSSEMGALALSPELVERLHAACADIRAMRDALMKALRIKVADDR